MGERRMLMIMVLVGFPIVFCLSYLLVFIDDESLTLKMCNHHSQTYVEITRSYKVIFKKLKKYLDI
jgi:hypothetical protein